MTTAPLKAAAAALASYFHYAPCVIIDNQVCGEYVKYRAEYICIKDGALHIVDQMGRKHCFERNWWIEEKQTK